MNVEYKVFIALYRYADNEGDIGNIDELNKLLNDGWIPIRETPAHTGGDYRFMTWLIILEREIVLEVVEPEAKHSTIDQIQDILVRKM